MPNGKSSRKPSQPKQREKSSAQVQRRKRKNSRGTSVPQIHPYCVELVTGNFSGCRIPSFNLSMPYATRRLTGRIPLTLSTASGAASLVVNPYLMCFGNLDWRRVSANMDVNQGFPTVVTNLATSPGIFPTNTTNLQVSLNGQISSGADLGYTGAVRPRYVKYRIVYTGTELNKGGEIFCIHNPDHLSLMNVDDADVLAGYAAKPSITSLAQLSLLRDNVTIHRLGDEFEFTWLPKTMEFQNYETIVQNQYIVTAGSNAPTAMISATPGPALNKYLPEESLSSNSLQVAPMGWTSGFVIAPASTTTNSYVVEVEAEIDITATQFSSGSGVTTALGSSPIPATQPAVRHPQHEAEIANVLGMVHQRRARANLYRAKSSALAATPQAGLQLAKRFASGIAESVGSTLAERLGSMLA